MFVLIEINCNFFLLLLLEPEKKIKPTKTEDTQPIIDFYSHSRSSLKLQFNRMHFFVDFPSIVLL